MVAVVVLNAVIGGSECSQTSASDVAQYLCPSENSYSPTQQICRKQKHGCVSFVAYTCDSIS